MRSCLAMVALLTGCREEPFEKLDPGNEPVPTFSMEQPVPLPPPPPSLPGPVPPPREIASFLTEAARMTEPWRVTINELVDRPRGERFLGYQLTRSRPLAQPLAEDLVARLALPTSYSDGDVGCVNDPVGIGVARGSMAIEFVEDCGHVYLTEQGHDGRWALFSSEMAAFIRELRTR